MPTNPDAYRGATSVIMVEGDEIEILTIMYCDARQTMDKPEIQEIARFHEINGAKG
jgi:hypothetical protein